MEATNQRWLSLTGICTTLNISHNHAKWLAKKGVLSYIPGRRGNEWREARFLDPTPEYQAKLKLGEALYGRLSPVPTDLDLCGMLTIREVAQVLGWSLKYARKFSRKRKLPAVRVGNTDLYSMTTVRRLVWMRSGRTQAATKQQGMFLLRELIDFFLKETAAAEQGTPTDADFAEDSILQRKLIRMSKLKSPERELAFQDFYRKFELARQVAHHASPQSQTPQPEPQAPRPSDA